jgi:hypothetical protein
MPPLITPDTLEELTAGKFTGDARIPKELEAASAGIRDYVGWHLYPSAECSVEINMLDEIVEHTGCDLLVQLPTKYLSEVESVTLGGTAYDFSFKTNGILRVYEVPHILDRRLVLAVNYTAGLPDELMGGIAELVAHRVTHSLVSSYGVTNETAGGVSITYNAAWINNSRATALPDDNKEVLAPYRLQGVF